MNRTALIALLVDAVEFSGCGLTTGEDYDASPHMRLEHGSKLPPDSGPANESPAHPRVNIQTKRRVNPRLIASAIIAMSSK
jgi:hypothetical protein